MANEGNGGILGRVGVRARKKPQRPSGLRRGAALDAQRRKDARSQKRRSRLAVAGRIVLFVVLVFLLVVPAVLLADPVTYIPPVAALLMVIVSWAYLQVLRRHLSVHVGSLSGSCERGQTSPLAVELKSTTRLPYPRIELEFYVTDLFGEVDEQRDITCALGPREDRRLEFGVSFAHLGTYHMGVSRVVIHDLLGLFNAHLDHGAVGSVTVRPRAVNMNQTRTLAAVPDDERSALRPVAADDVDYAQVREYRYGDALKNIHWNLSARDPRGTMYTRLYETQVNPTLGIVIDPYSPDLAGDDLMALFDGMVEVAVALAARARQAGVDAEIRYVGRDGAPAACRVASDDDVDDLVADMLRITPASSAPERTGVAEQLLRSAALSTHGCGNAVAVTSRPDAGLVTALMDISMRRRNAMAFLAVPRMLEGKERERFCAPLRRLEQVGAAYYGVESNEVKTEVCAL